MSQPRFYLDAHISRAVLNGARSRGIDVVAAYELGKQDDSDFEQLTFAVTNGRIIVTKDADFVALDAEVQHWGVLKVRDQNSIGEIIEMMKLISDATNAEENRNCVHHL